MRKMIARKLKCLHRDERGADMVEYILVIAAVALPLLLVLSFFWRDISKWAGDLWERVKAGESTSTDEL